jgi:phosphate:Na+ symporter
MLDERFLSTPFVALEQCQNAILNMANVAVKSVKVASKMIGKFSQDDVTYVVDNEAKLDLLDDKISKYIVKIKNLPSREDKSVSNYLHTVRDFERIGDHAENIMSVLVKMSEDEVEFSDDGKKELGILSKAVEDILESTMNVLTRHDIRLAESVEPLEEAINFLRDVFKGRHINRLKHSGCTIEAAVSYNDISTDFERIAAHCSNIALYAIEAMYEKDGIKFEAHQYSQQIRVSDGFGKLFDEYKAKYLEMLGS